MSNGGASRSISRTIFKLVRVVVGRNVLERGVNIKKIGSAGIREPYPEATHDIVDVVAKARGTSPNAGTETEFVVGDEAGPFMVLETLAEGVAIDETTN